VLLQALARAKETPVTVLIALALIIGCVIFVGCVAYGVFGYREDWQLNVRAAEVEDNANVVVEEIRQLRIGPPNILKTDRVDRHWSYTCYTLALWCYGWSVFVGASPTGNLANLDWFQQKAFAGAILIGASLVTFGSLMGQRIGRWRITPWIANNLTSPRIKDDVRMPYAFAITGLFILSCAMAVFGVSSVGRNGFGALGGWISWWTIVMAGLMSIQMVRRVRTYQRARKTVIADAVEELERRHAGD
jgi:hypothetical protein